MGCGGSMTVPGAQDEDDYGRKVFCVKFQKEMRGLDETPFEGHPLGAKVFDIEPFCGVHKVKGQILFKFKYLRKYIHI